MSQYQSILEEARRHLARAEVNLETEEFEEACMRARDAAERALSAYLASKGLIPEEEEEDLLVLLQQAQTHDPAFGSLQPILKELNRFRAPETAKPHEIRTTWGTVPDERTTAALIQKARQVLNFVETKL